jgi:hypothetical protein
MIALGLGLSVSNIMLAKAYNFRLKSLPTGEPPEGELDVCQCDEGQQGAGHVLVVLSEAAVATEPGERALDHQRRGNTIKPVISVQQPSTRSSATKPLSIKSPASEQGGCS